MIFDNFKHYLKDLNNNDDRNTLYGINTNPSHKELENCISELYNCKDTIIAPSGLAALVIPFFAYLKKGDEVLINDSVYSPTRTFCDKILKDYKTTTKYYQKKLTW